MTLKARKEVLRLLEETIEFEYPMRWADEQTTMGDFDGREFTIDVFDIPLTEDLVFLAKIRDVRNRIYEMIGSRCLFIFHSPEATQKYYAHIFPRLDGVCIETEAVCVPLYVADAVYSDIEINNTIHIQLKAAA